MNLQFYVIEHSQMPAYLSATSISVYDKRIESYILVVIFFRRTI